MDATGAMLIAIPHAGSTPASSEQKKAAEAGSKSSSDSSSSSTLKTKPTADAADAKRSFWSRFRLAQANDRSAQGAGEGAGRDAGANDQTSAKKPVQLEQIVVTAQKRAESLQDVPVPVSAISADTLVDTNQVRLLDYYSMVPGLSMTSEDFGAPVIAIRGVTTGPTNPTVGIVVDDVPYGSSTNLGGGSTAPDLDPSDLAHIEVLRGPQGTLYGASSLGGLLKFVTVDPSTDQFGGQIQMGLQGVRNGNDVGYSVRGSVNAPLSDTFALRASGFSRRDPGYIDDPSRDARGVNEANAKGGRVSALWRLSDVFTLKLGALLQQISTDGSSSVLLQPGVGDLEQKSLRGTGGYDKKFQVYNATLRATLGNAELTAISGYSVNTVADTFDFSFALGGLTGSQLGAAGAPLINDNKTKKFTQEIRLSMPIGARVEWLIGGFYNDESSHYVQRIMAADPSTGAWVAEALNLSFPTTFKEYAAFTDITFRITDRFDIQVGGRESQNKQSFMQIYTGPFTPFFTGGFQPPHVNPLVRSKENAFTYLLTPRLRITPDLMVYARIASGFRPGGPNINATSLGLPQEYDSDTTQNYEVGIKGEFLDHRLSIDASVFNIDWKDMQLSLIDPNTNTGFYSNAGRARSRGVELAMQSRPTARLSVSGWLGWNDAKLSENFPASSAAAGRAGDRLPLSSRFSGNVSMEQQFSLARGVMGFVGGAVSYVGNREGVFTATTARQTFPAYAKTDVRGGAIFGDWTANLFVNNVTDRRGLISGGIGALNPSLFTFIQPRTVGVSVSRAF